MSTKLESVKPSDIEARSFEIIKSELPDKLSSRLAPIITRVIYNTGDFDYTECLCFSRGVVTKAERALQAGVSILTDTSMTKAGINRKALSAFGGEVLCFTSDDDIARSARLGDITRAAACIDKAARLDREFIFAIGSSPTALIRLHQLIKQGKIPKPPLIIGVPPGFINVSQAKELITKCGVPYIISRGQKGGCNVASAICNALIYGIN